MIYFLQMVLPLTLKTSMYYGVFRWQRIPATLLNCIIIAGSGIIVSQIPLFFIPDHKDALRGLSFPDKVPAEIRSSESGRHGTRAGKKRVVTVGGGSLVDEFPTAGA